MNLPTFQTLFSNKLNCLQKYDIALKYRIIHKMVKRLSQHNFKIPHQRHIKNLSQTKQ